jgi:DNA invertase Pin-like site-specific DNA recombinase
MRVLGAVRLSRHRGEGDPSTSPPRQEAAIAAEVARHGWEVTAWARDLDVSATRLAPFGRPELGAWLRRPDEYDGICWSRLDRAVRSMTDLAKLAEWATEHRKMLIFAAGPGGQSMTLDLRAGPLDPIPHLIVTVLAFAAQMEAQSISDRVKDTKLYLRRSGRHAGGPPPFWLRVVDRDGGGKTLMLNPETAPLVRELVRRVTTGESQQAVARDFTARRIPSPSGKPRWNTVTTGKMLRSRALIGEMTLAGEPVRDERGQPIRRCEPLLNHREWHGLQQALDRAAQPNQRPRSTGANLLTKVARCAVCGGPRYYRTQTVSGTERIIRYIGCGNNWRRRRGDPGYCHSGSIHADDLEAYAARVFLDVVGDLEVLETVPLPAEDPTEELAQAREALRYFLGQVASKGPAVAVLYEDQIAGLERTVTELAARPTLPPRPEQRPTGRTYRQVWESGTVADRRRLLMDGGFSIAAAPHGARSLLLRSVRPLVPPHMAVGQPYANRWADAGSFTVILSYPMDIAVRLSR